MDVYSVMINLTVVALLIISSLHVGQFVADIYISKSQPAVFLANDLGAIFDAIYSVPEDISFGYTVPSGCTFTGTVDLPEYTCDSGRGKITGISVAASSGPEGSATFFFDGWESEGDSSCFKRLTFWRATPGKYKVEIYPSKNSKTQLELRFINAGPNLGPDFVVKTDGSKEPTVETITVDEQKTYNLELKSLEDIDNTINLCKEIYGVSNIRITPIGDAENIFYNDQIQQGYGWISVFYSIFEGEKGDYTNFTQVFNAFIANKNDLCVISKNDEGYTSTYWAEPDSILDLQPDGTIVIQKNRGNFDTLCNKEQVQYASFEPLLDRINEDLCNLNLDNAVTGAPFYWNSELWGIGVMPSVSDYVSEWKLPQDSESAELPIIFREATSDNIKVDGGAGGYICGFEISGDSNIDKDGDACPSNSAEAVSKVEPFVSQLLMRDSIELKGDTSNVVMLDPAGFDDNSFDSGGAGSRGSNENTGKEPYFYVCRDLWDGWVPAYNILDGCGGKLLRGFGRGCYQASGSADYDYGTFRPYRKDNFRACAFGDESTVGYSNKNERFGSEYILLELPNYADINLNPELQTPRNPLKIDSIKLRWASERGHIMVFYKSTPGIDSIEGEWKIIFDSGRFIAVPNAVAIEGEWKMIFDGYNDDGIFKEELIFVRDSVSHILVMTDRFYDYESGSRAKESYIDYIGYNYQIPRTAEDDDKICMYKVEKYAKEFKEGENDIRIYSSLSSGVSKLAEVSFPENCVDLSEVFKDTPCSSFDFNFDVNDLGPDYCSNGYCRSRSWFFRGLYDAETNTKSAPYFEAEKIVNEGDIIINVNFQAPAGEIE